MPETCSARTFNKDFPEKTMAFFSDIFSRAGRVARGQANQGMSAIEDARTN